MTSPIITTFSSSRRLPISCKLIGIPWITDGLSTFIQISKTECQAGELDSMKGKELLTFFLNRRIDIAERVFILGYNVYRLIDIHFAREGEARIVKQVVDSCISDMFIFPMLDGSEWASRSYPLLVNHKGWEKTGH